MEKDGEDFPSTINKNLWEKAGFSFGKTPEAPWVMLKGGLPELYWYAKLQKKSMGNVSAEEGSLLFKLQQQFLRKKEAMKKEVKVLVSGVFLSQKDSYIKKLSFIFDNYVKQDKLEESLPIQEMLEALKTAKNLDDLPLLALPVHAKKEKVEFEKQCDVQSKMLVEQKKAEYMAFKEKYITALTRLKAKLIGEKDVKNALIVEDEIQAMKADAGLDIEEVAYLSEKYSDCFPSAVAKHDLTVIKGNAKKVSAELTNDNVVEIAFPQGTTMGSFLQLTIKTMQGCPDFAYLAELDLLDARGNILPRNEWRATASSAEIGAEKCDVAALFDGEDRKSVV